MSGSQSEATGTRLAHYFCDSSFPKMTLLRHVRSQRLEAEVHAEP
jgi:hypothetical protein